MPSRIRPTASRRRNMTIRNSKCKKAAMVKKDTRQPSKVIKRKTAISKNSVKRCTKRKHIRYVSRCSLKSAKKNSTSLSRSCSAKRSVHQKRKSSAKSLRSVSGKSKPISVKRCKRATSKKPTKSSRPKCRSVTESAVRRQTKRKLIKKTKSCKKSFSSRS